MKIIWVILLAHIVKSESKLFNAEFGQITYQELSPTPFDVPPVNESLSRGTRIVFGSSASTGQFPHFALIFVNRPTATVQCGAGLIKDDWAITADHCVREALSIELRLGLTYREKYEQKLYASALARFTAIDLALIKLSTNIRVTNLVKPALLPRWSQLNDALVGRLATVCGMGIENQKTSAISNYLQYTQLEIISLADCNKIYGNVDSSKICAKHKTALSSTCPGDSGSPLVLYENGQPVIVGIVSFGAGAGCDLGYPVGYVKTTGQLSWITAYTGIVLRT